MRGTCWKEEWLQWVQAGCEREWVKTTNTHRICEWNCQRIKKTWNEQSTTTLSSYVIPCQMHENVPHRHMCVNTLSAASGAVWRVFRRYGLIGGQMLLDVGFGSLKTQFPVCSLCFTLTPENVSSWLPASAAMPAACCSTSPPRWTLTVWNCNSQ